MKPIYSVIVASFFLVAAALLPSLANAVVCQNKTVIVYSNGMFNDAEEANVSKKELMKKLIISSQAYADQTKYDYKLAFASDGSQYSLQPTGIDPKEYLLDWALQAAVVGGQLGEVVLQKVAQDDFSAFWRWLAGLQSAGSRLQDVFNTLAAGTDSLTYIYDPDLQNQVSDYQILLNAGKRVVIVSHSQGNLYANSAYDMLVSIKPAWSSSIGVVQVASPASSNQGSKLGNNEPHVTVPEDTVMKFVRISQAGQLILPTKPDTFLNNSPNMGELTSVDSLAWWKATIGHNFVTWYLAGTYTHDFIMKGIVDTINGLVGGYAGLQYPKKCIQWPPIQTSTSWQKVLTHDWQTNRSGLTYSRRIRDDVNEMMFNSQYNWRTGLVNIQAVAFDDSSSGVVSGSQRGKFFGFVPVPGGVGAVWGSKVFVPNAVVTGYQASDWVYSKWDTSIIMESFVWDKNTLKWASKVSNVALPRFNMKEYYVSLTTRGGILVTSNVAAYHDVFESAVRYRLPEGENRFVQVGQNHSWLLVAGRDWGEVQPTEVPWALIEVKNGSLTASGGMGTSYYQWGSRLVRPTSAFEVAVPQGNFSPVYLKFNRPPLLIASYIEECGYMGCRGRYIKPLPSVPDYLDVVDQRIVGGSDTFIVGQGIQSALGFYSVKVLAASSQGSQLMNQFAQVDSTKRGQGSFIATAKDL